MYHVSLLVMYKNFLQPTNWDIRIISHFWNGNCDSSTIVSNTKKANRISILPGFVFCFFFSLFLSTNISVNLALRLVIFFAFISLINRALQRVFAEQDREISPTRPKPMLASLETQSLPFWQCFPFYLTNNLLKKQWLNCLYKRTVCGLFVGQCVRVQLIQTGIISWGVSGRATFTERSGPQKVQWKTTKWGPLNSWFLI